jgi:hypothetical protein
MFADATLLESLPNGGAVVAIIVVVILFLRKIEASESTMKDITAAFLAECKEARKDYREHITSVLEHFHKGPPRPK